MSHFVGSVVYGGGVVKRRLMQHPKICQNTNQIAIKQHIHEGWFGNFNKILSLLSLGVIILIIIVRMAGKTRKIKGGKYIGRGTYGCSFRPALKCIGEAHIEQNAISKVLIEKNAEKEFKINELLSVIDPEQIFTLYPYKICKPIFYDSDKEEMGNKCDDFLQVKHSAIFLKDGGENLNDVLDRVQRKGFNKVHRALFRGLHNLFIGLEHLHSNNFIHLDIKASNVVCKITSGKELKFFGLKFGKPTYLMKFIDFGFSGHADTVFSKKNTFEYVCWPFELRFVKDKYLNGTMLLETKDLNIYLNTVAESKQNYVPYWLYKGSPILPSLDEYNTILKYLKSLEPEGKKEMRRDLLKKADVYSLGLLLSQCYYELTGIRKIGFNIFTDDSTLVKAKPSAALSGRQHELVSLPLYNLVDKMTEPDFRKRLNATDALSEFKTVLQGIETYFSEK